MKPRLNLLFALFLLAGWPSEGFAETLNLKVVVKLREKPDEKIGRPFADVGGFALRRNNATYERGKCPDLSDARGEITCRVECDAKDGDMRLHLTSPGRESARIVAGLSPPNPKPIEVSACKVKTGQPIEVVYLGLDVVLSEFTATNKEVYDALTTTGGALTKFKPFNAAAPTLEAMATNPRYRSAMLEFSRIASAYQEAPPERKPTGITAEGLGQYANGLNSVVLKGLVSEFAGAQYGAAVKVSPDSADFVRSVAAVERRLDAKPILNKREIDLAIGVREMKTQPKDAPDKLERLGRQLEVTAVLR